MWSGDVLRDNWRGNWWGLNNGVASRWKSDLDSVWGWEENGGFIASGSFDLD
jgi:hypothetical protein